MTALTFLPYSESERRDIIYMARRELLYILAVYRYNKMLVRGEAPDKMNLGKRLNRCKFRKKQLREAADRLREILYIEVRT